MIFSLSVFVSLTLSTLASADGAVGVKLSKISEVMPVGTSDFTATYFNGSIEGSTAENKSKSSIVLLGGCSSEDGNKYISTGDYPGFACQEFSDKATVFYPDAKTFAQLPSMPQQRTRHTAVVANGKIYVVGGRDESDANINDVIVFNPETQSWSTFITLDVDYVVSDHGSVVRGDKIYIFGGYDSFYVAKTKVFSIDAKTGTIDNLTSMLTKRGDVAAVHYNHGNIDAAYIIGGFNEANNFCAPLTTVERYNFGSDSWTESSSDQINLGSARGDKAAVVIDKKILVIGGEDKHEDMCDNSDLDPQTQSIAVDDVEVLDPLAKNPTWTYESDLPQLRFRAAAAVDEKSNTLYFFGGQKAYDQTCDCYKTSDDVFSFEGSQSKNGLSAIVTALIFAVASVLLVGGVFLLVRSRRSGKIW